MMMQATNENALTMWLQVALTETRYSSKNCSFCLTRFLFCWLGDSFLHCSIIGNENLSTTVLFPVKIPNPVVVVNFSISAASSYEIYFLL